ncbi:MAG TPA: hypothetical protein ENN03_10440 [bacterium]|nr:hypothetical protein [bacterium]
MKPQRVINAAAPTRICDVGGWTDNDPSGRGAVFQIAVYPHVEVQLFLWEEAGPEARFTLSIENAGQTDPPNPDSPAFQKLPLIEAALKELQIPGHWSIVINLFSHAPPRSSLGTSAAVSLAIMGTLEALTSNRSSPVELVNLTRRLETGAYGSAPAVHNYSAAAFGGVTFIEFPEPGHQEVAVVELPENHRWELEHRLVLISVPNRPTHSETGFHTSRRKGPDDRYRPGLERLEELASSARESLLQGDFRQLGRIFQESTEVQRELDPGLIHPQVERILPVLKEFDVAGSKVNGGGGSMAILASGDTARKHLLERMLRDKGFLVLPVRLARQGLRVWEGSQ